LARGHGTKVGKVPARQDFWIGKVHATTRKKAGEGGGGGGVVNLCGFNWGTERGEPNIPPKFEKGRGDGCERSIPYLRG